MDFMKLIPIRIFNECVRLTLSPANTPLVALSRLYVFAPCSYTLAVYLLKCHCVVPEEAGAIVKQT
jgi:hypothetical protein